MWQAILHLKEPATCFTAMPKRNGAQGDSGLKDRTDTKVVNGEEEVIVECSTSAASQEFQDGSQHESEEGQEVRCRKRWADVESDDEEEHFPSFSGEKSFVAQKTVESADGKESTGVTAEEKEEEWQEVTAKKKQQKPPGQLAAPQEEPSSRTGREGGQRAARRGDDRRRKDKDGKDSKDNKDGKEKKEPRRRGGGDRGQGNGGVRPRRGDGENNERQDNQPQRSSEKKEAPKEIAWRKKSTEEVGQADKPKEVKDEKANNEAESKTEEKEAGRETGDGRNRRSKERQKEQQQESQPKQPRQNSGRNDGNRRGGGGRGERGGRRSGNGGNGGNGGNNGNGNRNRGPTAEDWFASRMQAVA